MEFLEEYYHSGTYQQVWEMFQDPAFTELRLKKAQLRNLEVIVDHSLSGFTISATGILDPSMIPNQIKRFVRGMISLSLVETWEADEEGAHGTLIVKVEGLPLKINSIGKLLPGRPDQGTLRIMQGEVRINVPVFGPRLEEQAGMVIPRLAEGEQEAANIYLKAK